MDTALVNNRNGGSVISVNDLVMNLEKKKELAQIFMKSGLIPNQLNTAEKVLVCMFKSQELGLPPLEGLNGMAVINGKVTLQGNLLLGLINRSNKAKKINIEEHDNYCSVTMSRRDYEFEYTFSFSMDEAKKAGLLDKQIWRQYPKTMLKWRAVSGCARVVFSDIIGGLYTPEEIISISDNVDAKLDENEDIQVFELNNRQKQQAKSGTQAPKADDTKPQEPKPQEPKPQQSKAQNSKAKESKTGEPVETSSAVYKPDTDENDEVTCEAIERIKNGAFWNGKVYKDNTVYLDAQRFKLSSDELETFLKIWNESRNQPSTGEIKNNEELPF